MTMVSFAWRAMAATQQFGKADRIGTRAFAVGNLLAAGAFGIALTCVGTTLPTHAAPQAHSANSAKSSPSDPKKTEAGSNLPSRSDKPGGKYAHLDMALRDDFFMGFGGDTARLTRGMKVCEELMAKYPKFAEAMVWHGSGLVFQSALLFQKGDTKKGMEIWQKGLDEMDAAVKLEPENISVLIPRAATLIPSTRFVTYKPVADGLWTRALSDYEKTYAAQKAEFARQPTHNKGELLFGLAEVSARLGKEDKARTYLKQIVDSCKGSDYATEAQTWLDKKTLTTATPAHNCIGCHAK